MNLKPLNDRVIIKPVEAEETTKSGIVIPDTARKERPQEGEVVAVGPGKRGEDGKVLPMSVKVGDKVIYSKYGGSEIKIDDQEYLIMREDDILAIVG
ncbi:MAG: co-chaperone GroES [Firmicutes bacterium]|nr:co-chaperone GroES [Bacillota bacterium]